jgi:transposase-like protein
MGRKPATKRRGKRRVYTVEEKLDWIDKYDEVKKSGEHVGEWASRHGIWPSQITRWRTQRTNGLLLDKRRGPAPGAIKKRPKTFSSKPSSPSVSDLTLIKAQDLLDTNKVLREGVKEILSLLNALPFRA